MTGYDAKPSALQTIRKNKHRTFSFQKLLMASFYLQITFDVDKVEKYKYHAEQYVYDQIFSHYSPHIF